VLKEVLKCLRICLLISAAVAGSTYCILLVIAPPEPVPKPFSFEKSASWITTQAREQATGCFRFDVTVRAQIVRAWITVATNGGYEVIVNGNTCARFFLWRPTRPFQNGLSESGQLLDPADPAIALNFPREYQWSDHDNAALPTWIDLTAFLRPGRNAICVEVESRSTTPAMILSGEIQLGTGEKIPIRSGGDWLAEPVPHTEPQDIWTYPRVPLLHWAHAKTLPGKSLAWRLVPTGVFEKPFRGNRIRWVQNGDTSWVEQDLILPENPIAGSLRVATDTPFQIWINGRLVQPTTRYHGALSPGPWFIKETGRNALEVLTEILNPDEVATLLPGQRYEKPRHGDPTANNFRPYDYTFNGTPDRTISTDDPSIGHGTPYEYSFTATSDRIVPTDNDTLSPGVPAKTNGRESDKYSSIEKPAAVVPITLTRDRRTVEFAAYSVTPLLQKGKNVLRIGLFKDDPESFGLSWQPLVAFDGEISFSHLEPYSFSSGQQTRFGIEGSKMEKAQVDGPIEAALLPPMKFAGYVYPNRNWLFLSSIVFCGMLPVLLAITVRFPRFRSALSRSQPAVAIFVGWIAAGVVLRSAMLERSEAIYLRFPTAPLVLLALSSLGATFGLWLNRINQRRIRRESQTLPPQKGLFLNRRTWLRTGFVLAALVLCFGLRAWQIDYQPPDDDEYASIQASLAIAKKGVPELLHGIFYTRSPFYHYLAGAVAAVFGSNLYSLRLLSVFFACGTAFLLWQMATAFTRHRSLAFCSVLLYAIHPYLVFSGHIARFYQQQQFLHLLCLYFFVRGFVMNSGLRDRYLTVAAFAAATLSQEITLLQIIPLGVCYLIFAQRRSWSDELRICVATVCALTIIAFDLAVFQIQCLTAVQGASPNAEATIGWHFADPSNFCSMFIGYSRLHVVLTAFLIAGLLLALRRKKTLLLCLHFYFIISVVVANLLITSPSFRYQYSLIPLWIFLSAEGMMACAQFLIAAPRHLSSRTVLCWGWMVIAVASWSPWRIPGSYTESILGDSTRALAFVSANLRRRPCSHHGAASARGTDRNGPI
jgi:4-amino-4-deoxy-L-arabinose transferase-like glycosyltransferase